MCMNKIAHCMSRREDVPLGSRESKTATLCDSNESFLYLSLIFPFWKHEQDAFLKQVSHQSRMPPRLEQTSSIFRLKCALCCPPGKHEERKDEHGFVSRTFTRKYT